MNPNQPLPFSEDMEKGLLCSICLIPSLLDELPPQTEEIWYIPAHRIIFKAIRKLRSCHGAFDFPLLKYQLKSDQQLEEIGGLEYLSEIWGFVPTGANWRHYFAETLDNYHRRFAFIEFTAFAARVCDKSQELSTTVVESAEHLITGVSLTILKAEKEFKEQVNLTIDYLGEQADAKGVSGVQFGIQGLDTALTGLQFSELCGIGAKPSDGKSALALNLACHAVAEQGIPTAIFSLEMPDIQQVIRIFSLRSGISMTDLRRGRMDRAHSDKLTQTATDIMPWPMHIEDAVNLTLASFASRCRVLRIKHGVRLFVLDMISLLSVPKAERYDLALSQVAQGCKNLALELDSVVCVLSQLNEHDQVKHSKGLFEASDVFLRLIKPGEEEDGCREILIEKNRMGPRGIMIPVTFDGAHMCFTDRTRGEPPPPPEPPKGFSPYKDS